MECHVIVTDILPRLSELALEFNDVTMVQILHQIAQQGQGRVGCHCANKGCKSRSLWFGSTAGSISRSEVLGMQKNQTPNENAYGSLFEQPDAPKGKGWKHIGNVLVDTGSIVLIDPCRAERMDFNKLVETMPSNDADFQRRFSESLKKINGIWTPTGFGDGNFPVYAKIIDNEVKEIR